jgi:hypothetical protein
MGLGFVCVTSSKGAGDVEASIINVPDIGEELGLGVVVGEGEEGGSFGELGLDKVLELRLEIKLGMEFDLGIDDETDSEDDVEVVKCC